MALFSIPILTSKLYFNTDVESCHLFKAFYFKNYKT